MTIFLNTFLAMGLFTFVSIGHAQPVKTVIGQGTEAFSIDQTEVTVESFAQYAKQVGLVTQAENNGGGFEYRFGWERRPGWTFRTPLGRPATLKEPAVHIAWAEAQAYCKHQGGELPTQAQWSKAAYTEQRQAPPAPFINGQTYAYPTGQKGEGANTVGTQDGWAEHAPVGSMPAGVNGLYDMGANVWEWLADAKGNDRLTAGGSWWYGPDKMKADGMQYKDADFYAVYVGFRCVYPLN